ncbi:hypothetical protein Tco_0343381 [Tanacetum coccineum]
MVVAAMKCMASSFAKLDKFEGVNFRRWQKKMHFLLSNMSVVYVLTTPIPEDGGDNATMEQIRKRAKWNNDDYFKHTLKHKKDELTLVKLGSHLRIEESLRVQDSDKLKGNNVAGLMLFLMENRISSLLDQSQGCLMELKTLVVQWSLKRSLKSMKSSDVTFWKEAIMMRLDSFPMGEQHLVLALTLPPSCKPFGCKWIFKRKLKVYGAIEKFKYHKTIDCYDIQYSNLIIIIMDGEGHIFLNGDLDEELTNVYIDKLMKLVLYEGHGEADVILGIRIKHESNKIAISQSYYIEKVLKKFNYFDCTPVSTPMDTSEKLMPNNGQAVSQLEYSRVIGCLMYAMTCKRPDIAFAVGKLSSVRRFMMQAGSANAEDEQLHYKWLMESEFVALTTAGKEAGWLKNFLIETFLVGLNY